MRLVSDGFTAWVKAHGELEANRRRKSRKRPKGGARSSATLDS